MGFDFAQPERSLRSETVFPHPFRLSEGEADDPGEEVYPEVADETDSECVSE